MKTKNAGIDWVSRISLFMAYLAGIVLAFMMILTFFDVVGRSLFNSPIIGSVEILTLAMGLLIYLGIGQTTIQGSHVRVDVLTRLLPEKVRNSLDVIVHILGLLLSALVFWRLCVLAIEQTFELNTTQNLGLPVWLIAILMSIFSFSLVTGMTVQLYYSITRLRKSSF
ncbi:MAG: TRAP transporter small permease [Pseudomonadota bacterium]|nr:TRAP transporter small permease [Pseudomonadota bacterium]